jgi:hypothetical protein
MSMLVLGVTFIIVYSCLALVEAERWQDHHHSQVIDYA